MSRVRKWSNYLLFISRFFLLSVYGRLQEESIYGIESLAGILFLVFFLILLSPSIYVLYILAVVLSILNIIIHEIFWFWYFSFILRSCMIAAVRSIV
jgi:hypothetical protein